MRGKWALVAGAVIALVIVGGVGGLTMRAFAGVAHNTAKPKTVTQLCVYVDHIHGGSSNGDLSVNKKYGHETCIEGKRGPAGNSSVVTWNKTIATPSVNTAKPRGSSAHSVDLAKIGPFTIRGYCTSGEGVNATTDVISAQSGSSLAWDDSVYAGSFNSGNDRPVSNSAGGSPQSPGFSHRVLRG